MHHSCVLSIRSLARVDGLSVSNVACRHEARHGEAIEHAQDSALVFVRRGCFERTVNGAVALVDSTLAYAINAGDEQRYDHPHRSGDDCTYLTLSADLVLDLTGGAPTLPPGPFRVGPEIDLAQRRLLSSVTADPDPHAVFEIGLRLAADLLSHAADRPALQRRSRTAERHGTLAASVREALAAEPGLSLPALARHLRVSPHHLSRVFREHTGITISRHRMRVRAREAAERIAEGEQNLVRIASDLGFADQPHLNRVLHIETGMTPTKLRQILATNGNGAALSEKVTSRLRTRQPRGVAGDD